MVWVYGRKSRAHRDSCHPKLIEVADLALSNSPIDISIVWGFRGESIQNSMFEMRTSKVMWPNSKHNNIKEGRPCSLALDFAPWINGAIPWEDTHAFALIAGVMFSAASVVGVNLRWGGDWDLDGLTTDQSFMDYGHIELIEVD